MKTTKVPLNIRHTLFNKEIYNKSGVFIIENFIDRDKIKELQNIWVSYYDTILKSGGRNVDNANSVNFKDKLPNKLLNFWNGEYIKELSNIIYGDNVALYHSRILIKDRKSDSKVFLHQDYCYHMGFPIKSNLFIPLFDYEENHGTLSFYPGTHQYGFLGDAGEIDKSKFHPWQKITPNIKAGDVVIMNSCLWHESGENNSDIDRVMLDIIIQPSDDPSGSKLICGEWETDFWVGRKEDHTFQVDTLFINSRIKKIKNYENNK
jgi:ectoine hydroxylase-related dioxygenase (phytanoyl-CoA dioxygenase family)